MHRLDAVVVGGGPAGSACAITLAEAGRAVVLVDGGTRPSHPGRAGDVLPPAVRPVLESLGVWDAFCSGPALRSAGIVSVWGGADRVEQDFVWSPFGDAWHVDRLAFDRLLLARAAAAGVEVRGSRARRAARDGRGWAIDVVKEGVVRRVHTGFLVEATGRAASITRLPELRRAAVDRQLAVVATVDAPGAGDGGDHRLLLEAVKAGWWYSAVVPGGRLVAGWITDADAARRERARLRVLWPMQLARTSATRARVAHPAMATPAVVGANSTYRRAAAGTWLAVGDAAAAYDPLCGQGVVRALETGRAGARAIISAQDGQADALDAYADRVADDFRTYIRLRRDYYGVERRWPDSPFWARRHAEQVAITAPG